MKNCKSSKRALVMSVLSIVLCLAMLMGSTFAWFTDSVSTGVNKIVAGNLDVEMEYAELNADGTFKEWKPVTNTVSLFDENALWEPGYTQVVYLKISNVGSLSLNYKLSVAIANEHTGIRYNKDEMRQEFFKLSDYLKFGAVESPSESFYSSRKEARDAIGEAAGNLRDYTVTGSIKASEKAADIKYITLVVYMPEDVKNEANHISGVAEAIPAIELGIDLFATQMVDESDSFGNDYDENAFQNNTESNAFANLTQSTFSVSSEADLLKLADLVVTNDFSGKTITLTNDITLTQANWVPIGTEKTPFKGTFDGANHTISGMKITEDANNLAGFFGKVDGATIQNLTVEGNITLSGTRASEAVNVGGICAAGEHVTIKNCTNKVVVDVTGIPIAVNPGIYVGGIVGKVDYSNASVSITNCTNEANLTANAVNWSEVIESESEEGLYIFVSGIAAAINGNQGTFDFTGSTNSGTLIGTFTNDIRCSLYELMG